MPKIVILTGAGVSAESGIRTFRDNGGLWENHRLEDVATPEAFAANPELVYRFYNERRQQLQHGDIQPNAAHIAIAELEQRIGDDLLLVTQNVDNLHERGGSRRVIHMHGELMRGRCCRTGQSFALGGNNSVDNSGDIDASSRCNCCSPGSAVRPDIVWFGEMPFHMEEIYQALWQADLFVAIGTSGQVYPAAGFVQEAGSAKTVELNLEPSAQESFFDEQIYGAASEIVPEFFRQFGG